MMREHWVPVRRVRTIAFCANLATFIDPRGRMSRVAIALAALPIALMSGACRRDPAQATTSAPVAVQIGHENVARVPPEAIS